MVPSTAVLQLVLPAITCAPVRRLGAAACTSGTSAAMASASSSVSDWPVCAPRRTPPAVRAPGSTSMTFEPRLFNCSSTRCCAPPPMAIIVITAATPMMMPSIVSMLRSQLVASARSAETKAVSRFMPPPRQPHPPAAAMILDDAPVAKDDAPPRPGGDVALVRDHDDGQALRVQLAEQPHDFLGGLRVERASGLVGQDQRRLVDQRARDRHALLLPARQLGRRVRGALAQSDTLQRRLRAFAPLGRFDAGIDHRQRHVVQRAGARQQVELLEDEADAPVADRCQRVAVQAIDLLAGQVQRARARPVKAAEDVHAACSCPSPRHP